MTLELFRVIPADLSLTLINTPINEEIDETYNEKIALFLKMLNIDYNYKLIH